MTYCCFEIVEVLFRSGPAVKNIEPLVTNLAFALPSFNIILVYLLGILFAHLRCRWNKFQHQGCFFSPGFVSACTSLQRTSLRCPFSLFRLWAIKTDNETIDFSIIFKRYTPWPLFCHGPASKLWRATAWPKKSNLCFIKGRLKSSSCIHSCKLLKYCFAKDWPRKTSNSVYLIFARAVIFSGNFGSLWAVSLAHLPTLGSYGVHLAPLQLPWALLH